MTPSFHVRAALCTAAVMFLFGALATGDLPAWMVDVAGIERDSALNTPSQPATPEPLLQRSDAASASDASDTSVATGPNGELPPVRYPELPRSAGAAAAFVPTGWDIVAREQGDLNGDRADDLVLLMRMRDPANILSIRAGDDTEQFDTNPHLLLVAFAEVTGGYRLAASNWGLFPRPVAPWNGEEPLGEDTIRLERGSLLIELGHLRGSTSYRFRWQDGAMRLIGYEHAGVSGGCFESIGINYLTGRARIEKGLISSDDSRVAWRGVRQGDHPTLDRIDVETFNPDLMIAGPALLCPVPSDD